MSFMRNTKVQGHLRGASLPRNMDLVRESHSSIIIGQLASGRTAVCRERDAVVDIENAGIATRGPDCAGRLDVIFLSVCVAV